MSLVHEQDRKGRQAEATPELVLCDQRRENKCIKKVTGKQGLRQKEIRYGGCCRFKS